MRKWSRNIPSVFSFFTSPLYLCHVASLYIISKGCFDQRMQIRKGTEHFHIVRKKRILDHFDPGHCTKYRSKERALCINSDNKSFCHKYYAKPTWRELNKLKSPAIHHLGALPLGFPRGGGGRLLIQIQPTINVYLTHAWSFNIYFNKVVLFYFDTWM